MSEPASQLEFIGDAWYQAILGRAAVYAPEDSPLDGEPIDRVTEYYDRYPDELPDSGAGGVHLCAVFRAGDEIVIDPDADPREDHPGSLWNRDDSDE